MPGYLIINGDSRRLPIDLASIDAVVTDPPYGMRWDPDSTRFSRGYQGHRKLGDGGRFQGQINGDDRPFDPTPWLTCPKIVLWGANHFGHFLPRGTTLVWIKRNDDAFGSFLSDAEIGWMKIGEGVYLHKDLSMTAEANTRVHQNQKPIGLMRWCIRLLKLPPDSLILDPYMGSGTTLLAALAEGHRAIGIEIDPRYCRIAQRRIERPHSPLRPARVEPAMPLFGDDGE